MFLKHVKHNTFRKYNILIKLSGSAHLFVNWCPLRVFYLPLLSLTV